MGIEAFGVSMRFTKPGVFEGLKNLLSNYPHIRMGGAETVAGFDTMNGEYSDGTHFIDCQLSCAIANNESTLAVRFSLCSHDSIDAIFIDLVSHILSSLDAEVCLMTSALKQKHTFLPGDSRWLIAALPDEIVEMRKYWQDRFGTKQGAVRVKDSFSFVGIQ